MATKANNAEGGSDTTAVTTGNSGGGSGDAWSSVVKNGSTAITFSNTNPAHGSLGYRISCNSTSTVYLQWSSIGSKHIAVRAYCYASADWPAGEIWVVRMSGTAGTIFRIKGAYSGGNLFGVNDSTSQLWASTTGNVSSNTLYRLEAVVDVDNGTVDFAYYLGDSTSPIEEANLTGAALGSVNVDNVMFGKYNGTNWTNYIYLDDLAYDTVSSGYIGPAAILYQVPVTDSLGTVDSPEFGRDLTSVDTRGAVDLAALASNKVLAPATDSTGLSDSASVLSSRALSAGPDSLGLVDTVALVSVKNLSVTDTRGVTDPVTLTTPTPPLTLTVVDGRGLTDGQFSRSRDGYLTEGVGFTDGSPKVVHLGTIRDPSGLTDGIPVIVSAGTVKDSTGLTDSVSIFKGASSSAVLTITDTLNLLEPDYPWVAWQHLQEDDGGRSDAASSPGRLEADDDLTITDSISLVYVPNFGAAVEAGDLLWVIDSVTLEHVQAGVVDKVISDSMGLTDQQDIAYTFEEITGRVFAESLGGPDLVAVVLVSPTVEWLRLVLPLAVHRPRLEDWFWRHYSMIPAPTQIALLVYQDGTVIPVDDLSSQQAMDAPFVAGGGHETILAPGSWQAQVLAAAGYELEPVT